MAGAERRGSLREAWRALVQVWIWLNDGLASVVYDTNQPCDKCPDWGNRYSVPCSLVAAPGRTIWSTCVIAAAYVGPAQAPDPRHEYARRQRDSPAPAADQARAL